MHDDNGSITPDVSKQTQPPTQGVPFNFSKVLACVLIPEPVYQDCTLSPGARLLWGIIRRLGHKTGQCFAADERLAAELAVTERQARRYCRQLVEARLLRETIQPGRATVRELLWDARFNSDQKANNPPGEDQANRKRRLTDGNRPQPRTDTSTPTLDGNVQPPRTDTSTPILIDFLRGSFRADSPPPLVTPPSIPPSPEAGGEDGEKETSQDAALDPASQVGRAEPQPARLVTPQRSRGNLSQSVGLHAGDRTPESLARYLHLSYCQVMDAEPGIRELNTIVKILRARKVDHIRYVIHMRKTAQGARKPITIALWIKIAAEFGQGVSAEELASPD